MVVVEVLFWVALAGLAWTQALYSVFAAALARLRPVPVRKGDPRSPAAVTVTIIVAAHDEEAVIERRLENLLAQRYPPQLVDIVVASDGSTDRTDELVTAIADRQERPGRVTLLRCPRAGKVAAQNRAVRASAGPRAGEVIAFTDANARWEQDALRRAGGRLRRSRSRLRVRAPAPRARRRHQPGGDLLAL